MIHSRAVLVAVGGLPPRDERLTSLQCWITAVIAQRGDAREREILHQYAPWYLLRRAPRTAHPGTTLRRARPGRPAAHNRTEKDSIRNSVRAAIRLLDLAAGKQLTLASITQADLDAWATEGRFTYGHCTATFVRWAAAGKHARPGLKAHYDDTGRAQQRSHDTERRSQDARRLLHDQSM